MAPQQKRSFLPYTHGINPEDLRLGSLFLNPLDPDDGLESKRFEYRESLNQTKYEQHIQEWTRREQTDARGFSLSFAVSRDSSLALKFSDLFTAEGHRDATVTATLEGKSGRRLKIKKPETFMREEVMTQEGVRDWIRTQASISYKGKLGKHKFNTPKIWMVTGIQFVTDGDVQIGVARSSGGSVEGAVDAGAIASGVPNVAKGGAKASINNSSQANTSSGFNGEQVWAAQFMEVKIVYGNKEDKISKATEGKTIPEEIKAIQLIDIADLNSRGIRNARDSEASIDGTKPTELVARIVTEDESDISDDDDIQLNEEPYIESLKGIDWDMYNECSEFLALNPR